MLRVDHSQHAQSPGSSLPGTRVAAHSKRAAPLLARFLLTAQGAGASGLFSQLRVRHGAAEKSIGITEKLLTKAKVSGQDPYIVLLEYQNSPLLDCNQSPAQLLFSRRTISVMPITNKLLQTETESQSTVQEKVQRSKALQKLNFDKSAKPLSPLNINDSVQLQTGKFWRPAKVISKHNAMSYTVQTRDDATYGRNRKYLMKNSGKFH